MTSGRLCSLKHQRQATDAAARERCGPQTTRDHGVLIMRNLIVWVFMYSLDGLLADEGTEYW